MDNRFSCKRERERLSDGESPMLTSYFHSKEFPFLYVYCVDDDEDGTVG
jgi:hypothetical protein